MSSTLPAVNRQAEILRHQSSLIRFVVAANLEGLTHEQSVARLDPAGNSANWVLGHLLCIYNKVLPMLGQQPVIDPAAIARYDRGSAPLDPAAALPLDELRAAWDTAVERVDAGLASFDGDRMDQPAPFSPSNDPNETYASLLSTVVFHQTYHAGQLGLLRRLSGLDGAIK